MMFRFLAFVFTFAVALSEAANADFNYDVPYTHLTEDEANAFAAVGMEESEVIKKCGPPNVTMPDTGHGESWQHLADPKLFRKSPKSFYAGFEIFLKNKKVIYFGIIWGRNSN